MIWLYKIGFFVACFILGWALGGQSKNEVSFGRNFLSFKMQIVVMIWLVIVQLGVLFLLGK